MNGVWFAFGLTVFAGMATGIGSIIAFTTKQSNLRFLSISTGFSAGVMLYVSFVEIFPKGVTSLTAAYGEGPGNWINVTAFFCGMILIGVIDNLVPSGENPHETRSEKKMIPLLSTYCGEGPAENSTQNTDDSGALAADEDPRRKKLLRMGLFTALAITIHNFPEGLATFLAALQDSSLGIAIAIAIALHNIPEGISVSVPIYFSTGNRRRAFIYSFISGLAEPFGAGVAYLGLRFFLGGESGVMPPQVMGILFSGVAGIMVYISLDQLLPTSRAYGRGHDSIFGLLGGMVVMALSLLLLK